MKEPRRLLEAGVDEFERELLASSDADVPTTRAYQRTLSSIGVGLVLPLSATAVAQGAAAAAPAAKLGILALGKWLAVGAVAGAVTASGAHLTARVLSPAPKASAVAAMVQARRSEPEQAPEREQVGPATLENTLAIESATARRAPPVPAPKTTGAATAPLALPVSPPPLESASAASAVSPASTLEREVAAIEAVRRELGRGSAGAALITLRGYYERFPAGVLLPEARVLEVSALLQAGERERARELGRRVVAREPHGAHAQTVRALLPELEKP